MSIVENLKEEYLKEARKLLSGHPTELEIFEDRWRAENYRAAYLTVDHAVRNFGLSLTDEARRADEEFYWGVVH